MDENDLLHGEHSYRDLISTVDESGSRKWIYSLKPQGAFYNARTILASVYLMVFFVLPFIKVNGMPLFLFNIAKGKFILFSKIFWPQDFFIFAIAMISFIVIIVLFTVIYGRLFCGWVCPQTIFMEFVFRKIEWWIDGNPMQQKKLKESPWTAIKILKRVSKHLVFFGLAYITAHTFLSYIFGVDELLKIIHEPLADHLALFYGLLFFSFLFYAVYMYVREIVCTTICPYGRLQGVMFDKNTMQVAYDYVRGETRERYSKNRDRSGGDCIDCHRCVDVCPTGIDIRNGLQLECVGCTACIDECDSVMDRVGFSKGLIRYASENQIAEGKKFEFTSRVKAYSALLGLLILFLSYLIYSRSDVDGYISRVKGQLYQEVENQQISNLYELKIINKSAYAIPFEMTLADFEGRVEMVGHKSPVLKPETVNTYLVWIKAPKAAIHKRSTKVILQIVQKGVVLDELKSNFYGPFK